MGVTVTSLQHNIDCVLCSLEELFDCTYSVNVIHIKRRPSLSNLVPDYIVVVKSPKELHWT